MTIRDPIPPAPFACRLLSVAGHVRLVFASLIVVLALAAYLDIAPSEDQSAPLAPHRPRQTNPVDLPVVDAFGRDLTPAEKRVAAIGNRLLAGVDAHFSRDVTFHVDTTTDAPCSYSYPDGRVVVTRSLTQALTRDSWLATVLAYETSFLLRERLQQPHVDLDANVVQLMARAGFDPREVTTMGAWVCGQTSIARLRSGALGLDQFAETVATRIRQQFPDGLPPGLLR